MFRDDPCASVAPSARFQIGSCQKKSTTPAQTLRDTNCVRVQLDFFSFSTPEETTSSSERNQPATFQGLVKYSIYIAPSPWLQSWLLSAICCFRGDGATDATPLTVLNHFNRNQLKVLICAVLKMALIYRPFAKISVVRLPILRMMLMMLFLLLRSILLSLRPLTTVELCSVDPTFPEHS